MNKIQKNIFKTKVRRVGLNYYKNKCKGITNTLPFMKVSEPVSSATNKPWNNRLEEGFKPKYNLAMESTVLPGTLG